MFEVLTRDEETQDILDELRDYRVPPEWFDYRTAAFRNLEVTGAVRIAPVGYVRDEHRDVIAEIANELLRVEGTSIAIAIGGDRAGHRGVGARRQPAAGRRPGAHRARDRLPARGTRSRACRASSHERRPPHRVEGGACGPLTKEQRSEWGLDDGSARVGANGPILAYCQEQARQLVAALRDLEMLQPAEMDGLLREVESAKRYERGPSRASACRSHGRSARRS